MLPTDRLLAATHRVLGVAATYTPSGGSAVACTVLTVSPDESSELGVGSFVTRKMAIEVRVSEIASPAVAGVFALADKSYRVAAAPKRLDPDNLVWTCLCDPL